MKPIEFTKEMKILSLSYNKDFDEETITLWYEQFKEINKDYLHNAVKKIIVNNKYLPSIAELLDKCREEQKLAEKEVLEKMYNDNYFKESREYEKVLNWLEKGIIPLWLLEDMRQYYSTKMLPNKKLIGE